MGLIYLDSCVLIYAVEDQGERGEVVRARMARANDQLVISPLVVLECLVGPLKRDDLALRDRFTAVFDQCNLVDLSLREFVRAAELRARYSLRTPDALHLAAAQLSACQELWTNDARLAKASQGLAVDVTTSPPPRPSTAEAVTRARVHAVGLKPVAPKDLLRDLEVDRR